MTKLQKAVTSALCLTFLFSAFFSSADKEDIQKFSMFFPGFSLGYSITSNNEKEKVSIIENDNDVKYSFKIFEVLADLFK